MAERFIRFHHRFKDHFQRHTRSVLETVGQYLRGLMQADPNKKNMEREEYGANGRESTGIRPTAIGPYADGFRMGPPSGDGSSVAGGGSVAGRASQQLPVDRRERIPEIREAFGGRCPPTVRPIGKGR